MTPLIVGCCGVLYPLQPRSGTPSRPLQPKPHDRIEPSPNTANVVVPRAAIWTTLVGSPLTVTGAVLIIVVPSPSWPSTFQPQHCTLLPTIAHECAPPAATPVAPLITGIGVSEDVWLLLPS